MGKGRLKSVKHIHSKGTISWNISSIKLTEDMTPLVHTKKIKLRTQSQSHS